MDNQAEEMSQFRQQLAKANDERYDKIWDTIYSDRIVPLTRLTIPSSCCQVDDHAFVEEVLAQYIRYTTVSITVWLNYDRVEAKFFADERIQDCGIQLTDKQRQEVMRLIGPRYFSNLRFLLCTPFRQLATLDLSMSDDCATTQAQLLVEACYSKCEALMKHLTKVTKEIESIINEGGMTRFDMADIDKFAALFVARLPPGIFSILDADDEKWCKPLPFFREWSDEHQARAEEMQEDEEFLERNYRSMQRSRKRKANVHANRGSDLCFNSLGNDMTTPADNSMRGQYRQAVLKKLKEVDDRTSFRALGPAGMKGFTID